MTNSWASGLSGIKNAGYHRTRWFLNRRIFYYTLCILVINLYKKLPLQYPSGKLFVHFFLNSLKKKIWLWNCKLHLRYLINDSTKVARLRKKRFEEAMGRCYLRVTRSRCCCCQSQQLHPRREYRVYRPCHGTWPSVVTNIAKFVRHFMRYTGARGK